MWDEQIEKLQAALGVFEEELYTDIKPSELAKLESYYFDKYKIQLPADYLELLLSFNGFEKYRKPHDYGIPTLIC